MYFSISKRKFNYTFTGRIFIRPYKERRDKSGLYTFDLIHNTYHLFRDPEIHSGWQEFLLCHAGLAPASLNLWFSQLLGMLK